MNRNDRRFAAKMQDLSGLEQRIIEIVASGKWLQGQLHRRLNLIVPRPLDHVASEFQSATGQRRYVHQIAHSVYRQLSNDRSQPALGVLAAVLTIFASFSITAMALASMETAPDIAMLFPTVATIVLLAYGAIWLSIGAQTLQRIRRRTA